MYADSLSVNQARDVYFQDNGFSLAGYTDRWVKLKVGPVPLVFPNTTSRKAAVKLHDLHHLATGYTTDYRGEAQIAAWEIAAGCGRHRAAWLLNLSTFGIGLWLAPRRVFRAFVRGRRSKTLYDRVFGEDLLALSVGDLRARLGLGSEVATANARDVAAFIGWILAALALFAASVSPIALGIWFLAV